MKKITLTTISVLALLTLGACSSQKGKTSESSKAEKSSQVTKKSSKKEVSKEFQDLVEQTKPTIEKMKETYVDVYSDIELKASYPETIVFTYTYKNKVEASQEQKEQMFKQLAVSIKPEIDEYKERFPHFQERFIYLNPDKSEAGNFLITQKDVEKVADALDKEGDVSTEES